MAPGQAVLEMLVLVLSTLQMCWAVPPQEPGQHLGELWVWGAAEQARAEPPPLSRRKRDGSGQQPAVTAATTMPSSFDDSPEPDPLLGSAPPPAPGTNSSLHRAPVVPTRDAPWDETDSPDPDLLLSPSSPPAPGTNSSLHRALVVPTEDAPWDETDSPDPDLLLSPSSPPAPTNASLHQALAAANTAGPQDETDSPDPDLLLSSVPPAAPGTNTSLRQVFVVPITAEPWDGTDSPDPDLLLSTAPSAAPGTRTPPQTSTTTLSWLTSLGEEGTATSGTDSSSATPPGPIPTTTGYKNVRKAGGSTTPTRSSPWDTKAGGTAVPLPWDPGRVMSKCLLAILLLALVAATFMVCTGVLGALLWRRARSARRRLGPTEMVCISSLLQDGVTATSGPRPLPARRHKLLLDGGPEADGDNLTLSSFLPEQP